MQSIYFLKAYDSHYPLTIWWPLENSKCESTRGQGPDEDILDLQGCHDDVVSSNLLSTQQKQEILEQNCICLLKTEPINFDLAKFFPI